MIRPRLAHPAALLAILLLAGCESDAAQLAREVTEARGDCTQEKLKAGDEACVTMMEKYANMGTSAIQTYIGAVKSLDRALDRMPPASFDTAGFGHPFSNSTDPGLLRDENLAPHFGGASLYADPRYPNNRYNDPRNVGDRYEDPRYEDPRYADPRYNSPRYPASRGEGPWYDDPAYGAQRYDDPRYGDRRYDGQQYAAPGYDEGRAYDPRRDYSGAADQGGYYQRPDRRDNDFPREMDRDSRPVTEYDRQPPARGLLLPPGQRLDRPWLRGGDDRYRYDGYTDRNPRNENLRSARPGDYLPSRPLPADPLRRYDGSDGY
jgi:hypothetical protein